MADIGKRLALVIGIDKYDKYRNNIPSLSSAVRDAQALGSLLHDLHGYEVTPCLDDDASQDGLRSALAALSNRVTEHDSLLFYFAGHGVVRDIPDSHDGPRGFFIPIDAKQDDSASFLPMEEVQQRLESLPCRHVLVILDCCFAGAFRWSRTRNIEVQQRTLYRERYERYQQDPAWQVLCSAAYDERALDVLAGHVIGQRSEVGEHSPFAQALLTGLRGAADLTLGDQGPDGIILASELYLYIEGTLAGWESASGSELQRPILWTKPDKDRGEYFFHVPGQQPTLPSALELNEANNPYRGLSAYAYQQENQKLYFGRAAAAKELVEKIECYSMVIVVGASGTGKSSLVQAGALPQLQAMGWSILPPVRPGHDPVEVVSGLAALAATSSAEKIVVVIDQLEELITEGSSHKQQALFFAELDKLRQQTGLRLHLIVTLRADFRPLFDKELDGAACWHPVPPMSRAELKLAITGPADERVLHFEPAQLVEQILDEVVNVPGALPMLSFTLHEMYRKFIRGARDSRALLEKDYHELGGVAGALSGKADELYGKLQPAEQATMRRLMLRMIALDGTELARRRVRENELKLADTDETIRVESVLNRLVEARLIVSDIDSHGVRYVEPAHDKLILSWKLLQDWKLEQQGWLLLNRQLSHAALEWHTTPKAVRRLWDRDLRLRQLQENFSREPLRLSKQEQDFMRASVITRRNRHIRLTCLVVAALCVLGVVTFYAYRQQQEASKQSTEASRRREEARQGQLDVYVENGRQLLLQDRWMEALPWLGQAFTEKSRNRQLPVLLAQAERRGNGLRRTLRGHAGSVNSASISPDGQLIVTAGDDKTANVWDFQTGVLKAALKGHKAGVSSAGFSPDGRRVVTASEDKTARVWDAASGAVLLTLKGHLGVVTSASFSPDGAHIVTTGDDDTARVWNALREEPAIVLRGHKGRVKTAQFSPNGRRLLTAGADATARLWDIRHGTLLATLRGHESVIRSAQYSLDGFLVATGSDDATARLWSAETGQPIATLRGHNQWPREAHDEHTQVFFPLQKGRSRGWVHGATFSPNGRTALTAGDDATARLWRVPSGKPMFTLTGHVEEVSAAAFNSLGTEVITASNDKTAKIWDARNGKLLATLIGHEEAVSDASFSPDGKEVITASYDGTVRIWDPHSQQPDTITLPHEHSVSWAGIRAEGTQVFTESEGEVLIFDARSGKLIQRLRIADDRLDTFAVRSDGTRLISATDKTAHLWDVQGAKVVAVLGGHQGAVRSAGFSAGGQLAITAGEDRTARIWDASTGKLLTVLSGHTAPIKYGELNKDGSLAMTLSEDRTVRVWAPDTGKQLSVLASEKATIQSAELSSDGKLVLTLNQHDVVQVWNVQTRTVQATLVGQIRELRDAHLSEDGKKVITASVDGLARVWSATDGQLIAELRGSQYAMPSARFSPDGLRVVTSDGDNQVRVWETDTSKLLATLPGYVREPSNVAFQHGGESLIVVSEDPSVVVYSFANERHFAMQEATWETAKGALDALILCRSQYQFMGGLVAEPELKSSSSCPSIPLPALPQKREHGANLLAGGHQALLAGNIKLSEARFQSARQIYLSLSAAHPAAQALLGLAAAALAAHDAPRARTLVAQAVAETRQLRGPDKERIAQALVRLAHAALEDSAWPEVVLRLCVESEDLHAISSELRVACVIARQASGKPAQAIAMAHTAWGDGDSAAFNGSLLLACTTWGMASLLGQKDETKYWAERCEQDYIFWDIDLIPHAPLAGARLALSQLPLPRARLQPALDMYTFFMDQPRQDGQGAEILKKLLNIKTDADR